MFSRKSRYFFVRSKKTFSNSACSLAARLRLLEYGDVAMLKQPMIEKLLAMRLHGMAESLKSQEQDPAAREPSFLERLACW